MAKIYETEDDIKLERLSHQKEQYAFGRFALLGAGLFSLVSGIAGLTSAKNEQTIRALGGEVKNVFGMERKLPDR